MVRSVIGKDGKIIVWNFHSEEDNGQRVCVRLVPYSGAGVQIEFSIGEAISVEEIISAVWNRAHDVHFNGKIE